MSDLTDLDPLLDGDPLLSIEDAWACVERDLSDPAGARMKRIRNRLVLKQAGLCAYCEKPLVTVTLDHVKPRSKGGSDDESNLVAACAPCNHAKGDLDVEEFIVLRKCGLV